jgi:hypothetical protein
MPVMTKAQMRDPLQRITTKLDGDPRRRRHQDNDELSVEHGECRELAVSAGAAPRQGTR